MTLADFDYRDNQIIAKYVADYVYSNEKIEAAIKHALSWIPQSSKRILDIGCGIGWSSWEFKKRCPNATVTSLESNESLIRAARILYPHSDIKFIHKDPLNLPDKTELFDVIVLLDVYELERRDALICALDSLLMEDGTLIFTTANSSLENRLTSKLSNFEFANAWHFNDCIHVTLSRKKIKSNQSFVEQLDTTSQKAQRVKHHLNRRVMPEGVLLPITGNNHICIVAPQPNQYSETFIRSHAEILPATVRFVHGKAYDLIQDDGTPIFNSGNFVTRIFRRLFRSSLNLDIDYFKRKAFARFLKESNVNAILAEYGPTAASILEVCVETKIPLVVHFHGYDAYSRSVIQEYSSQYEKLFAICSAVVCGTAHMQNQLISLGAPREKIHINPCGVDPSFFQGAKPDEAEPLFAAVGRFVDKKAPYITLLAFEKVLKSVQNSRLIMVGDGPLLEVCRQLAESLEIKNSVEFPGPLPLDKISSLLRKARVFVQHSIQTSYGDAEGTGITILEAGATGLPVVSTRHMGIAETVRHEETGFLVEERDIEMMAHYMLKLALDPSLAARMGAAARRHVVSNYSMEKSINGLWGIIEKATKSRIR